MGTFNDAAGHLAARTRPFRRIGFAHRPHFADAGLIRPIRRFPFVPNRRSHLDQDCYEAFNIQVEGLARRFEFDRRRAHGDRRLGRARLDARADRRRQGLRPARPAAHGDPRLHHAGLRDQRGHEGERLEADERARRHRRGDRHPPRRPPDARRHGPPVRRGRAGLRRDLRERAGGAAHRLPVPAGQPAQGLRDRHRRPVGAGARLVHLRRRRPDEPLRGQRRGAEDADPVPDPLVRRLGPVRSRDRRGARGDPFDRDLAGAGAGRRRRGDPVDESRGSGPTSCTTSSCTTPSATGSGRRRSPSSPGTPGTTATPASGRSTSPRGGAAAVRPADDRDSGSRPSSGASSASPSSSARRCRTGRRSPPAAPCRRAATGGRRSDATAGAVARRAPARACPIGADHSSRRWRGTKLPTERPRAFGGLDASQAGGRVSHAAAGSPRRCG